MRHLLYIDIQLFLFLKERIFTRAKFWTIGYFYGNIFVKISESVYSELRSLSISQLLYSIGNATARRIESRPAPGPAPRALGVLGFLRF